MFTLNCKGRLLEMNEPVVMGIININADSFYEGSRFPVINDMLKQAEKMLKEGAIMLDIGAQSTRPGHTTLGVEEELKLIIPVMESLQFNFPDAIFSIDTYHAKVAKEAVHAGASIVNDISGGSFDISMLQVVASLQTPFVCMHVKGTAETMHKNPEYKNLAAEIIDYFILKLDDCRKAGIKDVIIDPGFGFSKTIAHNFELFKNLSLFSIFEKPLLLGISRKSTIYKTLQVSPAEALNGTTVLNTIGLMAGANILRVHDVKEAVEAIKLVQEVTKA